MGGRVMRKVRRGLAKVPPDFRVLYPLRCRTVVQLEAIQKISGYFYCVKTRSVNWRRNDRCEIYGVYASVP